jgi:hypothetical protein
MEAGQQLRLIMHDRSKNLFFSGFLSHLYGDPLIMWIWWLLDSRSNCWQRCTCSWSVYRWSNKGFLSGTRKFGCTSSLAMKGLFSFVSKKNPCKFEQISITMQHRSLLTPKIPWDQKLVDYCLGSMCEEFFIFYFFIFFLDEWTTYFTSFSWTPRTSNSDSVWARGEFLLKTGIKLIFPVFFEELLHAVMWPRPGQGVKK